MSWRFYLSFLREKSDMFVLVFVCLVVCLHFGGTCIRICNDFCCVWNTEKKGKNYPPVSSWVCCNAFFVYINIFLNHVFLQSCIIIFLFRDALVVIISRHCFQFSLWVFLFLFFIRPPVWISCCRQLGPPGHWHLNGGSTRGLCREIRYLQIVTLDSHCFC